MWATALILWRLHNPAVGPVVQLVHHKHKVIRIKEPTVIEKPEAPKPSSDGWFGSAAAYGTRRIEK